MTYIAIEEFRDLEDKEKRIYKVGDKFPKDDREIPKKRLDQLLGNKNRLGYAVIEVVKDDTKEEKEKTEAKAVKEEKPTDKKTKNTKKGGKNGDDKGAKK